MAYVSIYDEQCVACTCLGDNRRTDIPRTWVRILMTVEKEGWFKAETKEEYKEICFCSKQCLGKMIVEIEGLAEFYDALLYQKIEQELFDALNQGALYTEDDELRHLYIDAVVDILYDRIDYQDYMREKERDYYQRCMS